MNQEVVSQDEEAHRSSEPVLIIGVKEDRNTILAALRFYQERGMGEPANRSDAIHDIATNDNEDISYDDGDIDDLCERVNGAPSVRNLTDVRTAELFAELRRREAMAGLHGAIGSLYDQLQQQRIIPVGSHLITYLAYRLKREESLVAGLPRASDAAQVWQLKIDQMGQVEA
ncbi:hypothetical protein A8H39_00030 [Paraburkholderia fungorum]|uniref:hypothetical protein n=1 Tax=Paraburkholderia fungorum TaxID=134537 RepID=UPI00047F4628|nr:hypothetical protein [Paraburkholderia fungorum]MBB5546547.1 hypothetical protein [Paraburkholderia fungorum]PNE59574.1 hypothetical protein A8H39_00030 [Paraburkholderia fungorum]